MHPLILILLAVGAPPAAPAPQEAALPVHAARKTTRANVVSGEIEAIDAASGQLSLKQAGGLKSAFALTESTHFRKGRRDVDASAFKATDAVVVHFRRPRSGDVPTVVDLADAGTWHWLREVRRGVPHGVILKLDAGSLVLRTSPLPGELGFSLSDATQWTRASQSVSAASFKVGDQVWVVSRTLSNGSLAARAVSDTAESAARERESTAGALHGKVESFDAASHKIRINTEAGVSRELTLADDAVVMRAGSPSAAADLKAGTPVSVRLALGVITRVTVGSPRAHKPSVRSTHKSSIKSAAPKSAR